MTRRGWMLILLGAITAPIGIVAYAISLYFLLGLVLSNGWAGFWAVVVTLVMIAAVIVVAAFYDNTRKEEEKEAIELDKQRADKEREKK
ncbi:hypothetical protein [Alkalicoccus daliensis]|uniref:Uncharacterized protein n=1 Tax=Alkalicoccus daliensis TaxID=745820 RepID=A0A1H0HBL9_9BACI|nr:hypothetical protein [Alkalicoccus daliensis]SDO16460.1 hypothetical protein SAMN04488053_10835 [Alkalicoccus daliensis]